MAWPRSVRAVQRGLLAGPKWYRWWDFGNGTMSDLGSHWNDLPWWALKLDHPLTIEAKGPPAHPEIAPASMHAIYTYGARGDLPPVTLHWHQGVMKPKLYAENKIPQWGDGVLFIGDKGMLLTDYGKHKLLPEETLRTSMRRNRSFRNRKVITKNGLTPAKPASRLLATFSTPAR